MGQVVTRAEKALLNSVSPEQGVIHALHRVPDATSNEVKPMSVAISSGDIALRGRDVPIASPWGYERGVVPAVLVECNTMVSIPGV